MLFFVLEMMDDFIEVSNIFVGVDRGGGSLEFKDRSIEFIEVESDRIFMFLIVFILRYPTYMHTFCFGRNKNKIYDFWTILSSIHNFSILPLLQNYIILHPAQNYHWLSSLKQWYLSCRWLGDIPWVGNSNYWLFVDEGLSSWGGISVGSTSCRLLSLNFSASKSVFC